MTPSAFAGGRRGERSTGPFAIPASRASYGISPSSVLRTRGGGGPEFASPGAWVLILSLLLFSSPAAAAPFLVGSWFGTGQPGDKSEMWIAHMGADGSFHAQFRSCSKGQGTDLFQTGSWVLDGDDETISITSVNGLFYLRNDSYKILSHDQNRQTYRYLPTGFVYTSRRVDDKFQMPDCEAIS